MYLLNHVCVLVLNHRPRRHPDPSKWSWSWSIWMTQSKTQSGRTRLALMWRNAGWVFTTATPSPRASTLPLPLSVTARGATQEMAHSTATKRERPRLSVCRSHLLPTVTLKVLTRASIPQTGATTSVVRASVVGAHGSSVNVPSAGRLTRPRWFSAVWSVM